MAKTEEVALKNGTWKLAVWISTLVFAAGGLCMTIQANKDRIHDVEVVALSRLASVEAIAAVNEKAAIGIKKDIERLNEKVGEVKNNTDELRSEQKAAFKEIFKRLPE